MKKILYILILLALTSLFGCKKRFEDGPLISFRSVNHRLEGTWKVDKFYINCVDSTDEFNAKLGCEIEFSKNTFPFNGNEYYYFYLNNCNNRKTVNGFWFWSNHYTHNDKVQDLTVSLYEDSTFTPVLGPFQTVGIDEYWNVLRLTEKECNITISASYWLYWVYLPSNVPSNNVYVLNLKKQ